MDFPPITLPPVEEIEKQFTLFDYIEGERLPPAVVLPTFVHNPSTGEPIAPQMASSPENIERALQAAQRAYEAGVWANANPEERAALLEKVADHLMGFVPLMAAVESTNTGIVFSTSSFVNAIVWLAFKAAAGVLRKGYALNKAPGPFGEVEIWRKPRGVAVAIVPWNSPAALAAHKVANALAAGCPVILKPSEWAPYSCLLLVEALEAAGLPRGLFQIVHGGASAGEHLVRDKRVRTVSFTGGLQGGQAVAAACALDFKALQLELGGNNAMVVLADAHVERVAEGIVAGLITLNGQWCRALGRLLVHQSLADEVLEAAREKLRQVKAGDALSMQAQLGPLANQAHHGRIVSAIHALQQKGGQLHQTTPMPEGGGYYLPPTLITGVSPAEAMEEIFGPVATVHPFREDEEAVQLANQTPYGLGGYVFSQDEEHALAIARRMTTGGVKINGVSLLELNVDAPRPAWGLSGFGEEGTLETFDLFCGKCVVGVAQR
ncbi:MAG: aldehyde dehydrogenase [Chloroflexi bacterium]|nr:aldehyde dehydrogenase [Ardenticatenaceae bacterium]NOG33975.1 aldehyde dehydrogenase [Chloroflexota bacterium]GIK55660.1 MAG: aldehyde dehydrogenase [Chloroflexota bacterium]